MCLVLRPIACLTAEVLLTPPPAEAELVGRIQTPPLQGGRCLPVGFSPDGKRLAVSVQSGGLPGAVLFGAGVRTTADEINDGAEPPGTAHTDGMVWVWDSRSLVKVFKGHKVEPRYVAFVPNWAILASNDFRGDVHIWKVASEGKTANPQDWPKKRKARRKSQYDCRASALFFSRPIASQSRTSRQMSRAFPWCADTEISGYIAV